MVLPLRHPLPSATRLPFPGVLTISVDLSHGTSHSTWDFYKTVDLVAISLAELGALLGEPLEVGDIDGVELEIIETTGLDCLCKTTVKGVPTIILVVTTKPASLTDSFLKTISVTGSTPPALHSDRV